MSEWAEREIKIGCKKENPNWDGKSFDYGCSCYQSALKAYKSLCEDGHSGFSFAATRIILENLLWEIPLTPIEDNEEDWNEVSNFYGKNNKTKEYQCKRRSSLFKTVNEYNEVSFHDNERVIGYELGDKHGFHNGLISKIVDELYPIKLPYMPTKTPFKVYCEHFLSDKKNGDYDMVAIFYLINPEGIKIDIFRYFDLRDKTPVEISEKEYFFLKAKTVVA